MACMIRNAIGDVVDLTPAEHGAVATKLLAFDGGVIKRLPNFKAIEEKYGVEIYHHMNVGEEVHEYHTNLDGMGYVVARANDIGDAILNAEKALKEIIDSIF